MGAKYSVDFGPEEKERFDKVREITGSTRPHGKRIILIYLCKRVYLKFVRSLNVQIGRTHVVLFFSSSLCRF